MERDNVTSSNIVSIWYNNLSSVLEIEFLDWWIYEYLDVPENEYNGLMNADSHWKYLNANIKGNYSYNKIW